MLNPTLKELDTEQKSGMRAIINQSKTMCHRDESCFILRGWRDITVGKSLALHVAYLEPQ